MKHLHKFVLGAVMLGLATFALGMMFFDTTTGTSPVFDGLKSMVTSINTQMGSTGPVQVLSLNDVNRAAANGDPVTWHKYCTDTAGTINFDTDKFKAWCKDHNL